MSARGGDRAARGNRGWTVLATFLACLFVLMGLAIVAYFVLFMIALSNWGNNK